ncbi:hypothetical protein Slin15195_G054520 [Septoria linicola]|uniref:Uncharacterized protein n=1 Tax=Septoria linicola TaxID=215465 RepID=A0A9Q9AS14_9PEZI|nr:hypothetical protein Slin14017_G125340 [Septoria linicola]USW52133.1 hypothetical protein Slin15195_G054520 [Septoria linicola]
MCHGTYVVSYSCGHVIYTPNVCLQDVAPHYRCEPRGMKITQPPARCVECYARELNPNQNLPTSARFSPDLNAKENIMVSEMDQIDARDSEESSRSSADSQALAEITRWIMALPPGLSPSAEQRSFMRLE